jgi:hypothetical protein
MNIRLHIDRLVLNGLDMPVNAGGAIRIAVERELARLLSGGGLASSLASGTAVPSVRAPEINATGTAAQVGTAIGRAIYGGIGSSSASQPEKAPSSRL